ncbi:hypothetical protein FHR99_002983 [Litorivivens lipolytica]|uniref:Uncharacterized protein n=1 Tax=Litorivivens lipolytica TaxID=1524264 RepID=A0A7W4Z6N6_9GAMM|nr:hypothetical protein [Litorivivens lipolytica]MBB3048709.1 hypothetical protein [Litorivivens lipolytica]
MNSREEQLSAARRLLVEFGISLEEIANHAQVSHDIADHALQVDCMPRCPVVSLIRVQTAAEILLRQKGWDGDADVLWQDFYAMLSAQAES